MFDEEFFDRLRGRVTAAGDRGMYVDVMLFEGWGIHLSTALMHIEGHPFHASNNVNRVSIGSILDYQVLPLDPACRSSRSATSGRSWTRFTISPTSCVRSRTSRPGAGRSISSSRDTRAGRGAEWGDSTEWQYWVIDVVKRHEQERGYEPHPIGITMQFPVPDQTKVNEPLGEPGEWISPATRSRAGSPGTPRSRRAAGSRIRRPRTGGRS